MPETVLDEYADASGTLRVTRPAPGVVVTKVGGHATPELARRLIAAVDAAIADGSTPTVFHDWEEATGYAPDVRRAITDWYARVRTRVHGVHVFTRSKIVAMGVSVVSLATGNAISAHSERRTFDRALSAERRRRGE